MARDPSRCGRDAAEDRVAVRVRGDGGGDQTLHEFLADALGVPRVELSCWFGSRRPNQKPIVRIHAVDDGRTIGFAKIGWDPLTSSLVTNEATFLEAHADVRPRTFTSRASCIEGPGTTTRSVSRPRSSGRRSCESVPRRRPCWTRSLASTESDTRSLAGSPYLASLHGRLDGLRSDRWDPIHRALAIVEQRWGGDPLRFGRWHGDWAPWNMARRGRTLVVWDWERTAAEAPVGSRRAALPVPRRPPVGTVRAGPHPHGRARGGEPDVQRLGVDGRQRGALVCLYAVEMQLRFASELEATAGPRWLERPGRGRPRPVGGRVVRGRARDRSTPTPPPPR